MSRTLKFIWAAVLVAHFFLAFFAIHIHDLDDQNMATILYHAIRGA